MNDQTSRRRNRSVVHGRGEVPPQVVRFFEADRKAKQARRDAAPLPRVRRLREEGVIDGYHAALQPGALGIGLQAMVSVQLASHSRTVVEQFREAVRPRPEVVALYPLGGLTGFLLHVAVRDPEHLRDLI